MQKKRRQKGRKRGEKEKGKKKDKVKKNIGMLDNKIKIEIHKI